MSLHSVANTAYGTLLQLVNEEVGELNLGRNGVSGVSCNNPDLFIHLESHYKEVDSALLETYFLTVQPLDKKLLARATKKPHVTPAKREYLQPPSHSTKPLGGSMQHEYFVTAYVSPDQRTLGKQPENTPNLITYQPHDPIQKLTRTSSSLSEPVEDLTASLYEKLDRMI